ncbi:DegT/DnrJ/EryC1/StrS aminotransferase family protein [uncultured Desulfovibrio sp.]|uniref:DegT/DnrJ/EryC1/StrS family aminotransferase n=1 Tax=uncultured Desulfovibrio sp. TaxID=167968 RepID=UPI00039E971E|nr:DegT/DnrJ/EryC1/StrS family aminotransferase [uncultured Desulfovibrio sp.]
MRFIDLAAQQARIRDKVETRIAAVLKHGHYIMGPEVAELEEHLCAFTGAAHCVTCASGSDALLMALMAWGIGVGDAIFVPPFTFFATAEMPALLGATPVFVDIEPRSFLMCPDALEHAIRTVKKAGQLRPRVVVPVDLFGQPAAYEKLLPIANRHGLMLLEDAAQSFGSSRHGNRACALGCHAAATSFFPSKPLGCYGDGGALFTDDAELAVQLRSIRVHGKGGDKYDNIRLGINGRLDTLQAAVLLAKLEIFTDELAERAKIAVWYGESLAGIPNLLPPILEPGNTSVWAQYCTLLPEEVRDTVIIRLMERGIPTNIYYPKPLHLLKAFAHLGYTPRDFPEALAASRRILALPFHPYLDRDSIAQIAQALADALTGDVA